MTPACRLTTALASAALAVIAAAPAALADCANAKPTTLAQNYGSERMPGGVEARPEAPGASRGLGAPAPAPAAAPPPPGTLESMTPAEPESTGASADAPAAADTSTAAPKDDTSQKPEK